MRCRVGQEWITSGEDLDFVHSWLQGNPGARSRVGQVWARWNGL